MSIFDGPAAPTEADYSVNSMQVAAAGCESVGPLPKLFMTSGVRDYPARWHGWGNATDWGNNADQWNGSPQMDDLARWLATFYGPWSLEIIHVYSGGLPAFQAATEEWKNGEKMPAGWYGWVGEGNTLDQHRGHVHWAILPAGLAAAAEFWNAIGALTKKDPFMTLPTVDTTHSLDMAHPYIRRLQGLLQANGLLVDTMNTKLPVLHQAVLRVQEINGWPMNGIADQRVYDWCVRSVK